jgi:hypothetical protein
MAVEPIWLRIESHIPEASMKSVRFIFAVIVFISVLVLAQSTPAPLADQPNLWQARQAAPLGALRLLRAGSVAESGATALKPAATWREASTTQPGINFAKTVQYNTGAGRHIQVRAGVADVNGDGKPDLLVADECADEPDNWDCYGLVAVLLGNGDGTFQPATTYASGGWLAASITVADVNRDGKPDLVVANQCNPAPSHCYNGKNGLIGVLLGNGDGTFQAAVTYNSGGYRTTYVAVADLNGDGKPDLVVASQCASYGSKHDPCSGAGTVSILLGNGDGSFQQPVSYSSGAYEAACVSVADVNNDGTPDVVVANQCSSYVNNACGNGSGTVAVLLGNGDGTLQTAVTYSSAGYLADSVAVADVNGDGKPDLVVANQCVSYIDDVCSGSGTLGVLLGNGDGTFQSATTYVSGGDLAGSVAVADVNGDGKLDLVVVNQFQSSTVGVLLGNGDGTFQSPLTYKTGDRGFSVAVADVNGDGRPDLLVGNRYNHGSVGVFINITGQ